MRRRVPPCASGACAARKWTPKPCPCPSTTPKTGGRRFEMNVNAALADADPSLRNSPLAGRLPRLIAAPGATDNIILDCIGSARFGLRGPGTLDWLASEGLALPQQVNTALTLPDGISVLRLGQQEVLLTAPVGGSGGRIKTLQKAWHHSALPARGYDAYRDEGW